jgi:hypothetical protein
LIFKKKLKNNIYTNLILINLKKTIFSTTCFMLKIGKGALNDVSVGVAGSWRLRGPDPMSGRGVARKGKGRRIYFYYCANK